MGVSVALGFVAVHLAPHWSAVSDPYSAFDADALSWALVALPILAALNLVAQAARAHARTRASGDARDRAAGAP